MSQTTPQTSFQDAISHRLGFFLFSFKRFVSDNISREMVPTVVPQSVTPVTEQTFIASYTEKDDNFFFQIVELLYIQIIFIWGYFFGELAKMSKDAFASIKDYSLLLGIFILERVLDIGELIYTLILDPFLDRFGHVIQGTFMALQSKLVGVILFFTVTTFTAREILMYEPRHILIYALVPFVMLMVFFYPVLGLCSYLLFGLGMLHKLIWHFPHMYTGTPLILASMGAYAFRIMVGKEKEFTWVHDNQNLIVMAMWSILTLALYSGWSQPYYYLGFVTWFVVYFLSIQIVGSSKQRLLILLYGLCLVYSIYAFKTVRNAFYYGVYTDHYVTAGAKGRLNDNNELGACLNMALPLLLGMALVTKNKLLKNILFITAVVDVAAIIYTRSRGALLGLSVLILPMIFKLILKNKRIRIKGIMVICIVAVLGTSFFYGRVSTQINSIRKWKTDGSAKNRIIGFITGMNAMIANPLYGIGAGNMVKEFHIYCPNVLTFRYWFGKDGTITLHKPKIEKEVAGGTIGLEVHNAYGAVAGENGIFVLFLWVFLAFYSIRQLRLLRKTLPRIATYEWVHILSHALELAILSYMLTSAFLNNFSEGFIYLIYAASLSLRHIALRRKGELETTSFLWLSLLVGVWLYHTFYIRFVIYSF